jgi:hypothetical protein
MKCAQVGCEPWWVQVALVCSPEQTCRRVGGGGSTRSQHDTVQDAGGYLAYLGIWVGRYIDRY